LICAVASGKGGTGKTTVTASLAAVWDRPLTAVDLDVEEPNLHLFLRPEISAEEPATLEVPVPDPARCTACGQCAAFCRFKALTLMAGKLLVFPEMCHGCGGCLALCPEGALAPGGRELGHVVRGRAAGPLGPIDFLMGRLRVGEAMSPPLMRQVKERLPRADRLDRSGSRADVLIDAPPGVSCPAVSAVMDADVIVLVTEPTRFGLHDLKLAVEAFRPMGRPMGVVVNRAGIGDESVAGYCREAGVPLWAEIPFSREAAGAYSRGEIISQALPELRETFAALRERIRAAANAAAVKEDAPNA
jgi:MinD superfamily P-loop ATPase